jgi:hypothetical protein
MLNIGGQEYERLKEFKYLGTNFTEYDDISADIKQQITMAKKTSFGLKKQIN